MYNISQNNQNTSLARKESFEDLRVVINEKLTFREDMIEKRNE